MKLYYGYIILYYNYYGYIKLYYGCIIAILISILHLH